MLNAFRLNFTLSRVRASLPMFHGAGTALKVYRDSSARVQTAFYNSDTKFVQAAINYTPTSLAVTKAPAGH